VLPLPGSLRGGAAGKVVSALLKRGWIREEIVDSRTTADAALNRFWRKLPEPDGRAVLLFITAAGAEAIGGELADTAADAPDEAGSASEAGCAASTPASGDTGAGVAPAGRQLHAGKTTVLLDLLRGADGASMAEMTEATGWQAHTVRSFIATKVRRQLGHEVASEKPKGRDRRWRIAG
jgi:hypothetical protein